MQEELTEDHHDMIYADTTAEIETRRCHILETKKRQLPLQGQHRSRRPKEEEGQQCLDPDMTRFA